MEISIHGVKAVEHSTAFVGNGNSRRIRIKHRGGELELVLYGKTESVALLPRSADFVDYDTVALYDDTIFDEEA